MEHKTGTVERIQYTFNGFGNQYTTINGTEYITYWDFADGIKVGATVEFLEEKEGEVRFGNVSLRGPRAREVKVIEPPRIEVGS